MPLLFALAFLDLLMGLMATVSDPMLALALFLFGAILYAGSRLLGPNDSRPLYSRRAWLALAVQCVLLTQTVLAISIVMSESVKWQASNDLLNLVAGTITVLSLITVAELRGWKRPF